MLAGALGTDITDEGSEVQNGAGLGAGTHGGGSGVGPQCGDPASGLALSPGPKGRVVLADPSAGTGYELTIAEEPRGSGALEVVILAEVTLVSAFTVAHTAPTLTLPAAGARLVLALPHAGLSVAQGARGAVAGLADPEGGTNRLPSVPLEEGWVFCCPILQT